MGLGAATLAKGKYKLKVPLSVGSRLSIGSHQLPLSQLSHQSNRVTLSRGDGVAAVDRVSLGDLWQLAVWERIETECLALSFSD